MVAWLYDWRECVMEDPSRKHSVIGDAINLRTPVEIDHSLGDANPGGWNQIGITSIVV